MSLMRRHNYDPFEEMDRMMNRMRSMMNRTLMPVDEALLPQPDANDANLLAVDVSSDEQGITVQTALPGFKEDEVNIDVRGNVLNITAETKTEREGEQQNWHIREMRYGKFARSVMLPEDVNIDKAEANLQDGILTVQLPKKKPSPIQKIAVRAKDLLTSGNNDK